MPQKHEINKKKQNKNENTTEFTHTQMPFELSMKFSNKTKKNKSRNPKICAATCVFWAKTKK